MEKCRKRTWTIKESYADDLFTDGRQGICLNCGEIGQFAEPDAREYTCYCCGCKTLYGFEEAIVEMYIEVVPDGTPV